MKEDIAQASNPSESEEPDVYAACVAFVKMYSGIEAIYQGWQNRSSLPPGTNVYATVSLLSSVPISTPIERMLDDDEISDDDDMKLEVARENELTFQIDVCGEDDTARRNAQTLHLAASSSVGIEFFKARGDISVMYAEDVKDLSFIGDAQQFVRRYMLVLHCSAWSRFTVDYDWFIKAHANIEDVDAHHHPKEV